MTYIPDCSVTGMDALTAQDCKEVLGQIYGLAFQLKDAGSQFVIATNPILEETNWNTFASAVDDTLLIYSPKVDSGVIPSSEGDLQDTDGNTQIGGLSFYAKENIVQVTGNFVGLSAENKLALNKVSTLSRAEASTQMTVYMFVEPITGTINPRVVASPDDVTTPTLYTGIPMYNFRVGSLGSEGNGTKSLNGFTFELLPNWSDKYAILSGLDFSALDKLI